MIEWIWGGLAGWQVGGSRSEGCESVFVFGVGKSVGDEGLL